MKFYTYIHLRESDNKVFYVGKGQGKRAWAHKGRNPHWRSVAAKHGVKVEVCAHWPTEQEAFNHEKFLLECFRDMGAPLTNLTDGGEGTSGCVPSQETLDKRSATTSTPAFKARLSASIKAAHARPEVKANRTAAMEELNALPEVKANRSAGARSANARPEVKAKLSAATKAANARPGVKAKRYSAIKAALSRPDVAAKLSANIKAALARPEVRVGRSATNDRAEVKARRSAAVKASYARPEVQAKHSETNARPEVKARRSAALKASHARPEVKAKISVAITASHANPATKAARKRRDAVEVQGVTHDSVRAAFIALQLPVNKHGKFRMQLKAAGQLAFGDLLFTIVPKNK